MDMDKLDKVDFESVRIVRMETSLPLDWYHTRGKILGYTTLF
jgi:hypothetical protein